MSESKEDEPILKCPHCEEYIIIEKLNCGIFRHGVIKTNGQQINPHASKEMCDDLLKKKFGICTTTTTTTKRKRTTKS